MKSKRERWSGCSREQPSASYSWCKVVQFNDLMRWSADVPLDQDMGDNP